jgi:hypothetical protein
MAGFEVVVRPAIFPNIRPVKAPQVPNPPDDPNADVCVITGSSGKSIDLPFSWSVSMSCSKRVETQRTVDTARVYQKEDDGTINKDNYVDVDVAKKINYRGGKQPGTQDIFVDPNYPQQPGTKPFIDESGTVSFRKVQEADNVKVIKADKVIINIGDKGGDGS